MKRRGGGGSVKGERIVYIDEPNVREKVERAVFEATDRHQSLILQEQLARKSAEHKLVHSHAEIEGKDFVIARMQAEIARFAAGSAPEARDIERQRLREENLKLRDELKDLRADSLVKRPVESFPSAPEPEVIYREIEVRPVIDINWVLVMLWILTTIALFFSLVK